ncbi:cytochrome P450 [Chaetomidium leptoderma]|uniref:Cytochrome P450 n=1 Tax=Chaetomidium leptoderma TaxID=669021 RepID=A0AAN6ZZ88_9PEZI|nr:cytochrome P450 [Chaetomidium leptoderma]
MALLKTVVDYKWHIFASIAALYVVRKFLRYQKLARFGGPWGTGFSEIPHNINIYTGEAHNWYRDISEKHGPIARVGPNALITSNADVWIHVNTKPGYKRTKWYFEACRVEHQRDHIFSQTDTKLHDERRKQIAPGYSGRENLELESSIDARVAELLTLIRTKYLSTPGSSTAGGGGTIIPMDLSKTMQFLTLDVISTVGMGRSFGMLRADADTDHYIRSSEQGLRLGNTFAALGLSWLAHAPVIGRLLAPKPTDTAGFGAMMGACFAVIDERVGNIEGGVEEDRRDMLASFVRHGLVGDELRSEVLETLIAGSDTTAGALRGIMLYVMGNKRVYSKLQDEIDDAVAEEKVAVTGEGVIPFGVAKQMPYLQAVIREGLRVWPPVRNILPKDVPAGGDTVLVEGKPVFLPGGVEIGYSSLAMHRDKKVYGEDADLFRPERWFEQDREKLAVMTRVNDLTFGHGRWQCLGKNVAQMELNKTVFELFRHFDWSVAHPATPWKIMNSLGLFIINDMWVQVTSR